MARRGLLLLLARGSTILAACVACDRLLGLEHGVPMPDACCDEGGAGGAREESAGSGNPTLQGGSTGSGTGGRGASGGMASVGGAAAGGAPRGGRAGNGGGDGGIGGDIAEPAGAGGEGGVREQCTSSATCGNPDEAHCSVDCEPGEDGRRCVVSPRDFDGDEHGDAACADSPGDDCDDALSSIGPQATEVCDGLDNDCSGKRDFEQGLSASGVDRSFADERGSPVVAAYSSEAGRFLAAWKPAPGARAEAGVAYSIMELSGEETVPGFIPGEVEDVAVAAGEGGFAILWAGPSGAYFQRLSAEGALGASVPLTTVFVPYAALVHTPSAGFVAFWQDESDIRARRIGPADQLGQVVLVSSTTDTEPKRTVASGNDILLVWQSAGRDLASWMPSSLVGGGLVTIGASGNAGDLVGTAIAARPDGFGVVGINRGKLLFEILEKDGTVRCGPVTLPEFPSRYDLAQSATGYLLIGTNALVELDPDCKIVQHAKTPIFDLLGVLRVVSAGTDGFLTVWENQWTSPPTLGWRRFGPHVCD